MENPINPWMIWGENPLFSVQHPFGIHPTNRWPWPRDFLTRPGGCRCTDKADSQVRGFRGWFFYCSWFFVVITVNIQIFTYIVAYLHKMWTPTKYMFIKHILYTYVQLDWNCCQLAREHIEGMLICCLEWLGSMLYFLLCLTGLIKPHQLKAVFAAFLVARKLAASPTFVHGLPFCCVRNAPRLELFPSEIYRLKAKQLMKVKWWNDLSYSTSQGCFCLCFGHDVVLWCANCTLRILETWSGIVRCAAQSLWIPGVWICFESNCLKLKWLESWRILIWFSLCLQILLYIVHNQRIRGWEKWPKRL